MEYLDSVWQIGIIALLAGALIGVLAYRLFASPAKEVDKVQSELDAARDELVRYKASVNQHFDKTSELVNELTQDYVRVYRHLAEGAQSLGDGKQFDNLLEQQAGKVSIAVDEKTGAPRPTAEDPIAATAVHTATAHSVDEHAEPFTDAPDADSVAAPSEADSGDSRIAETPDAAGEADEDTPANTDARVDGQSDAEDRPEPADADHAARAEDEKTEARPTA